MRARPIRGASTGAKRLLRSSNLCGVEHCGVKHCGVRIVVLLGGLLAACTYQAAPLALDAAPPRDRVVLTGRLAGASEMRLQSGTGRVYRVQAADDRFCISVPPGVYEVVSVGGVPSPVPLILNGLPGDVLGLGCLDLRAGRVDVREPAAGGYLGAGLGRVASTGYVTPSVHTRSGETPGRYYSRTGNVVRPLPGSGRAGMGLGLRGR